MLWPSHRAAFPAKITRRTRDLPFWLLLWEESPNSSNFTPPNPRDWCRRTTKVKCSKTQKVELDFWYRGKRRGKHARHRSPGCGWPLLGPWQGLSLTNSQGFQGSVLGRSQAISPCSIRLIGTLGILHKPSMIGASKPVPQTPRFFRRRCATNETQMTNPCHFVTLVHGTAWNLTWELWPRRSGFVTLIFKILHGEQGGIKGSLLATPYEIDGSPRYFRIRLMKYLVHDLLIGGKDTCLGSNGCFICLYINYVYIYIRLFLLYTIATQHHYYSIFLWPGSRNIWRNVADLLGFSRITGP